MGNKLTKVRLEFAFVFSLGTYQFAAQGREVESSSQSRWQFHQVKKAEVKSLEMPRFGGPRSQRGRNCTEIRW